MTRFIPELNTIACFSMINVGLITGILYYGHMSAPDLQIGAWPSLWYGFFLRLPLEQRYPFDGVIFSLLPSFVAGITTVILPYTWGVSRYVNPPQTHPSALRSLLAYSLHFFPMIGFYWLILPLEGTPLVLMLLETGLVIIVSYFPLFGQDLPDLASLKKKKTNATEYLKLRHEDNKTALTVAVGSGFSIILTLLIGAVTFFYGEVLRYGIQDPRGLFPYYQTLTVVVLAAMIMIEWAYELVFRFYKQMTGCTKMLWDIYQ